VLALTVPTFDKEGKAGARAIEVYRSTKDGNRILHTGASAKRIPFNDVAPSFCKGAIYKQGVKI